MFIQFYNDEIEFRITKKTLRTVLENSVKKKNTNRESKSKISQFSYTVIFVI